MRILVIGDAHIKEHDDLKRFRAFVRFLKKWKIDKILIIGDFLEMACLSNWDKNKKKTMENKRFKNEINNGNEALDIIQAEFKGEIIYLEGNHEFRVESYLEVNPIFDGVVNVDVQLKLAERKIKWIKYKENYNINGISFTHIPIGGNGNPIGGSNIIKRALSMYSNSVVFGHTHNLKVDHEARHNSDMNLALNVGCFFEEEHAYRKGTTDNHWKGLCILDSNKKNHFDLQTISLDNIMKNYKEEVKESKEEVIIKKSNRCIYDYSGDKHAKN